MRGLSLNSTRLSREQAAAWLARVAVLLAAACCVWVVVQLAWSLLTPLSSGWPGSTSPASLVHKATDTTAISSWHLFGNAHTVQLQKRIMQDAQASSLKLRLHGTVAERGNATGYALIADANGVEHSYRVGDRIDNGVTLKAVYADHVLLANNGHNERLDLPRESLHGASAWPAGRRAHGMGSKPAPGAGDASAPAKPIYVSPRIATGRVDWHRVQSNFSADPARVIASLGIQPVFDGGRMRGVRLAGAAGNPLIAAAGLRSDDVVTEVNGIKLDSLARGQQLFNQLRNANRVNLTILRNGRSETLSVDVPAQP